MPAASTGATDSTASEASAVQDGQASHASSSGTFEAQKLLRATLVLVPGPGDRTPAVSHLPILPPPSIPPPTAVQPPGHAFQHRIPPPSWVQLTTHMGSFAAPTLPPQQPKARRTSNFRPGDREPMKSYDKELRISKGLQRIHVLGDIRTVKQHIKIQWQDTMKKPDSPTGVVRTRNRWAFHSGHAQVKGFVVPLPVR